MDSLGADFMFSMDMNIRCRPSLVIGKGEIRFNSLSIDVHALQTRWSNAVMRRSTNLGNTGSNPVQVKDLTRQVVP